MISPKSSSLPIHVYSISFMSLLSKHTFFSQTSIFKANDYLYLKYDLWLKEIYWGYNHGCEGWEWWLKHSIHW